MRNTQSVDNRFKPMEKYLSDKRDELVWALLMQDYTVAQVARIFNVHRSLIHQILKRKPEGWKPKWRKVQE